jgi:dTDP-glucose pyrophosphorylase
MKRWTAWLSSFVSAPNSLPLTKAVILAAGRGTRMGDLTDQLPKPMVKVGARPVLDYIVEGLRGAGISDLLIVVGYRREVIQDYFQDGAAFGLQIQYVEQIIQDGTGKVVELAREFCRNEPFLLSYGDILVSPETYLKLLDLEGVEMTMTVRYAEDVSKGGAVILNEKSEVVDLREKPKPTELKTNWYNAGIYVFRASIFPFVARLEKSPRGEYELTDAIRAMLVAGYRVRAIEIKGSWADVRDPEVLAELNRAVLPQKNSS